MFHYSQPFCNCFWYMECDDSVFPTRKRALQTIISFNTGQKERRLIPWHFEKVIGERTSSFPEGRVIWPWQTSWSWDFLWERLVWNGSSKNRWGKDVTARTSVHSYSVRPASGTESNSPGNKIIYKENEQLLSWLKVLTQEKSSSQAHKKETEKFLNVMMANVENWV